MFRLLEVLLESRPRAISKSELHDRIWPRTFVSEAALSTLIADLRRAIGEDGHETHLIRTVHGFGYAFSGQVSALETTSYAGRTTPSCYVIWESRRIALDEGEHLLGRAPESRICIDDPVVSRRHARLVFEGSITIEDLGSKNGTYLNDRKIETPMLVADGDRISVGPACLICRIVTSDGPTLTQPGREI
jgi:hypothetical protein